MYVCMYIYKTQQRRFIHPCVEKRKGAVVFPTAFLIYLISGTLSNLSKAYPITTTKGERNNGQQHTHVAMKSSKRDLSSRGLLPTFPEAANGSLKIPTSILFESLRLATHKAIFSVTAKTSCLHTHRNHQSLQDLARVSCMSVLSQYWKQHLPIYTGPFWHGKPPGPSAAAWSPLLWRRRAVMISGLERTCSGQIRRFFFGEAFLEKEDEKMKAIYNISTHPPVLVCYCLLHLVFLQVVSCDAPLFYPQLGWSTPIDSWQKRFCLYLSTPQTLRLVWWLSSAFHL